MNPPVPGRLLRFMGRTMRWIIYLLLLPTIYAFGSALVAYVQVRTGWGLSAEEAQNVHPAMGHTAGLFIGVSLLMAAFSVLAIRVVRRLEERADEA
jgi:amino acid transporter